ncbi:MAG: FkbM family methyltransferase, partial [Candidatus Puniceispirillaceae bacterium]
FAMTKTFLDNDDASRTITYDVETVSVMELVGDRSLVDFMSLDIEGAEMKVLESIDFDRVQMRVIAVENNDIGSPIFRTFFDGIGYRYFDTIGHDEIYYHPDSVSFTRD